MAGKRIVLGVTGSIAAYKAADLTSKLVQQGALVDVVMSEGAVNFVAPLTFRSLTHRPVLHQLFDPASGCGDRTRSVGGKLRRYSGCAGNG